MVRFCSLYIQLSSAKSGSWWPGYFLHPTSAAFYTDKLYISLISFLSTLSLYCIFIKWPEGLPYSTVSAVDEGSTHRHFAPLESDILPRMFVRRMPLSGWPSAMPTPEPQLWRLVWGRPVADALIGQSVSCMMGSCGGVEFFLRIPLRGFDGPGSFIPATIRIRGYVYFKCRSISKLPY